MSFNNKQNFELYSSIDSRVESSKEEAMLYSTEKYCMQSCLEWLFGKFAFAREKGLLDLHKLYNIINSNLIRYL